MGNGMNLEQAKTCAEKMSYSQAVCNALCGYGVPYRKATKIKLNELLDVAKNTDARHAHWINITYSNCNFTVCADDKTIQKMAYCPHCGSKIDGGENAVCYVASDDADVLNTAIIKALEQEPRWIPCSKKMPKENEYVDNVCKYYLIQDEYGDMHVAHYTNTGWRLLDSLSVLYGNVVAWQPLPEEYKEESCETLTLMRKKQYCDNDREAYEKGKEKMNRYYSILRPVSLGTFPGRIRITKIHNYDYRTRVDEIQYVAWGYFETPDKLTEQECYEYDLVEGDKNENMG